jgi:hypothetical protein
MSSSGHGLALGREHARLDAHEPKTKEGRPGGAGAGEATPHPSPITPFATDEAWLGYQCTGPSLAMAEGWDRIPVAGRLVE